MGWINSAVYLAALKRLPGLFIILIVLGAEYLSYVKSIETHVRTFLTLNILPIGTVFKLANMTRDVTTLLTIAEKL